MSHTNNCAIDLLSPLKTFLTKNKYLLNIYVVPLNQNLVFS